MPTHLHRPINQPIMAGKTFTSFEELVEHVGTISDLKDRVERLLLEWQGYIYSHPKEMAEIFEAIRKQATTERNQRVENLATLGVDRSLRQLGEYDDALGALQAGLGYFQGVKDDKWSGYILTQLGHIRMVKGEYTKALEYFSQSLELYQRIDHKAYQAAVLGSISMLYGTCGDYQQSLDYRLQSLALYREVDDKHGEASALLGLGFTHAHLDNITLVEECYQEAREIWQVLGDEESEAKVYHNLGELYLEFDQLEKALRPLTQALETFQRHGHKRGIAKALGSLGRFHQENNELERAVEYYEEAIVIAQEIEDLNTLALITANAGRAYILTKEYDEALKVLGKANRLATNIGLSALEQGIEDDLGTAYAALGDFEKAYRHRSRAEELLVEVLGEGQRKAMSELQIRFDLESAMKEKEIYRLRNEQLEMIMEQRSKELAGMALHLVEKAELMESFGKQVKKIARAAGKDARSLTERLLEDLDKQNLSQDWERFEQQFDQTQGGFVRRLLSVYPELTPTEARMSSLLKIGLSTKEIASLLNVSERNVESHRYHIRKKLDLQSNQTLVSFLRGFEEDHASRRAVSEDQSFTVMLSSRYPELSETELKVCTLTRNGLTTKEIAEFLGVSQRTAEKHRYNVRKKLGLKKGQNLQGVLAGL